VKRQQCLFDHIADEAARAEIERDMAELVLCMRRGAWKAALVLSGSIVESNIYYCILQSPRLKSPPTKTEMSRPGLAALLRIANRNDILPLALFRFGECVREYRNAIHPDVRERMGVVANENTAQAAYSVLQDVVRSVRAHLGADEKAADTRALSDIVRRKLNRQPNESDGFVYLPILRKYGRRKGSLIIERSLDAAQRARSPIRPRT
jgi:hypothetical protein